ncbi:MAG TPA: HD domain-containing protein, partial [Spirochaetota bacterium]|nr:HD domain-containing protein [Spirochaetota bacterium]
IAYNKDVLNPIIYALKDSKHHITDEYKKVELNGKIYYGASIFTLEDNNAKFERFIAKLKNFNYFTEADLLYTYLVNNINLLTDKIIQEKFKKINNELYEELVSLNETKFTHTCIGHIILSEPSEDMFDKKESLNFIFSMVMKSIFKMSEILLINDFEFQEFQKEMLVTLQQISKLRDIETAKHQDRVTIYTQILAEALRQKKEDGELDGLIAKNNILSDTDYHIIDDEYIRDLLYGASLHDLGKVGIDDDILKNPNKLNEEEYEAMKQHTVFGYQRLTSIVRMSRKKSFLVLAAALAENHHEMWNGNGYPNHKKKFEIPLSARILAIADVYDALRQKRSYKEPITHQKAVEIIISEKEKHFDPILVDIFKEKNALFNDAFINNNS